MAPALSAVGFTMPFTHAKSVDDKGPKIGRDVANTLAHRASLGRIVALVANERIVDVVFKQGEQLYYVSPLRSSVKEEQIQNARFLISGSTPFRARRTRNGNVIPTIMHESNIRSGRCSYQQYLPGENGSSWVDIEQSTTADRFVAILREWTGWDLELTRVFEERIRCSTQYLADSYAENRPCPTRESDYITWEQAIVEANGHPLHKCRMPVDPRTQPTNGFDFKRTGIAFMAVKRSILAIYGPLEAELASLLAAAGVDSTAVDSTEIVIPVHEFQVKFLLSLPKAANQLRLLPHKIGALAQSSTRTMTVASLPGMGFKLSLSLIIGDNVRTINSRSAFNAVRYWTAGMLDPIKVVGLQGTPLEILPEVTCANGLGDHLAVMIRWDPFHSSRPTVDHDVGYAVAGALSEPAIIGQQGCVADSVFNLTSHEKRLGFLRNYTRLYFQCFLKPLFMNGLLIDAHGQNSLLRFSRATGQLLGFSARDMSGTRFNRVQFERTTGIAIDERMSNHDLSITDLLERAYFIFFVVHLGPLIIALDLQRLVSTGPFSARSFRRPTDIKKISIRAKVNGWTVVAHELHRILSMYENPSDDTAASIGAREVAAEARAIWMDEPTWPMQCFISQRMRADWAHRDKSDKASTVSVPNMLISEKL